MISLFSLVQARCQRLAAASARAYSGRRIGFDRQRAPSVWWHSGRADV